MNKAVLFDLGELFYSYYSTATARARQGKKGEYTYKLSGAGKSWIKNELLPKLRQ